MERRRVETRLSPSPPISKPDPLIRYRLKNNNDNNNKAEQVAYWRVPVRRGYRESLFLSYGATHLVPIQWMSYRLSRDV